MPEPTISTTHEKNPLYCSFCGKSQHEVPKLIAGPTVFICNECIELCVSILQEEGCHSAIFSLGIPLLSEKMDKLMATGMDTAKLLRESGVVGEVQSAPRIDVLLGNISTVLRAQLTPDTPGAIANLLHGLETLQKERQQALEENKKKISAILFEIDRRFDTRYDPLESVINDLRRRLDQAEAAEESPQ